MQLAQVGDARVGGEVGLAVDHVLQRALGLAVAAELDQRVDEHGVGRERVGASARARCGRAERAAEVVAGERERAALGRARPASLRAPSPAPREHAVGARRRSRGRRSRAPSAGTRRRAARRTWSRGPARDGRLQAGDARVGVGVGGAAGAASDAGPASRRGAAPRRGRAASTGERRQEGERRGERGRRRERSGMDEGPVATARRCGTVPHWVRRAAAGPARAPARRGRVRAEAVVGDGDVRERGPERLVVGSTPSPSGSCLPPCSGFSSAPAITRSSMSTTSSPSRRPFGKPAVSPASTPKRFGVGGRRDAQVDLERVGRHRRCRRSASGRGRRSAAPARCPCGCSP